jgi:hypothetical protein
MLRAAIDADIFFFSISQKSENLTKRDINPYDIKKFLFHLSGHPDISLCVPISVLGEVVIIRVEGEWKGREGKHNREELHELIDIWSALRIIIAFFAPFATSRKMPVHAKSRSFDERRTIMF